MKTKCAAAIASVVCLLCLAASDWVNVQSSPRKKIGRITFDLYSEIQTNLQVRTYPLSTNLVRGQMIQQWVDEGYVRSNVIGEAPWRGKDGNRRIVKVVFEDEELATTRRNYDVIEGIRVHRETIIIPR